MSKTFIHDVAGVSRQAHAAFWKRRERYGELLDAAEAQLQCLRKDHPGLGLQKAWYRLRPEGISRDRFCHEMTWRGYALAIKRNYVRVTRSAGYRFPNLIKGLIVNAMNQVWQSDTTYYRIGEFWYYLTFIIDVYSRKIVGYCVSKNLQATANIKALKQAMARCGTQDLTGLIFHSDGGTQYRSKAFVSLLRQHGISSSMCEVALDNAYAERINGVIKQEYLDHWQPHDYRELCRYAKRAVNNYNTNRIHGQLPIAVSPIEFTEQWHAGVEDCRGYAVLIKDGQGPSQSLDADAGKALTAPGKYAYVGGDQILPADVIFLDLGEKVEKSQSLRA